MTRKPKTTTTMINPDVLGAAGGLVAVKQGSGRYPYKVVRPVGTEGAYSAVSQSYSSPEEVLADLRLRTGTGC
jgi:hypothetical protein